MWEIDCPPGGQSISHLADGVASGGFPEGLLDANGLGFQGVARCQLKGRSGSGRPVRDRLLARLIDLVHGQ